MTKFWFLQYCYSRPEMLISRNACVWNTKNGLILVLAILLIVHCLIDYRKCDLTSHCEPLYAANQCLLGSVLGTPGISIDYKKSPGISSGGVGNPSASPFVSQVIALHKPLTVHGFSRLLIIPGLVPGEDWQSEAMTYSLCSAQQNDT